jgi:hypothetical protein
MKGIKPIWIILFVTMAGIISCQPKESSVVERKALRTRNPTTYVFNEPKSVIRIAIISALGDLKYKDLTLLYTGSRFLMSDTFDLFEQPGNSDDFLLTPSPSNLFPFKSVEYFRDSLGVEYHASFHLHIVALNEGQTQVDVITIDPKIIVGVKDQLSPHLKRPLEYQAVEPSTVEEYEILRIIGYEIGTAEMPKIIYP